LSRLPLGESVRAAPVGGLDHFELKRYRSLRRSRSSVATAFAKVPDGAMYVPRNPPLNVTLFNGALPVAACSAV